MKNLKFEKKKWKRKKKFNKHFLKEKFWEMLKLYADWDECTF